MTDLSLFVLCPSCGHQAKGRHLLGLLCRKCSRARLISQQAAYEPEKRAPAIRLNTPWDANPWPNQQGRRLKGIRWRHLG